MIGVNDIYHSFDGKPVLKGVTFELAPGSLTGLIGPSGVGKSVLIKIMGGVLKPDRGTVTRAIDSEPEMAAGAVSLMFQEGALFDSLSVFDNIAFPLVHGRVPCMTLSKAKLRAVHEKVHDILDHVGLCKASQKYPAQLSGGMRRRISLARALVSRPKILLLDDPTSGLDPVASGVIMNLIGKLHNEYRPTTVLVSQDLRRLLPAVEHVMAMFDGKIVFSGELRQLIECAGEAVRHFVSCRFDCSSLREQA